MKSRPPSMIGDDDDDAAALARVVSELESVYHSDSSEPFSEQSLLDLHSLYISNRGGDVTSNGGAATLWDTISAKSLAASALLRPISTAMDDTTPRYSLLASRAYLCLLLLPSSPIFSLLTPLSLLSLLRSLRRYTKSCSELSSAPVAGPRPPSKKRKAPAKPPLAENFLNAEELLLEVLDLLNSVLSRTQLIDGMDNDSRKSLVDTVVGILTSSVHRSISDLCFEVLYSLILFPKNQTESSVDVLKSLSTIILSTSKLPEREAALTFIIHQLVPLAEENNEVRKALIYLPRYLAMKAQERSEPRAAAVEVIIEVVKAMRSNDQIEFAKYVVKLAHGKAQLRLLSVDLIFALLTLLTNKTSSEEIEATCFKMLFQRCLDNLGTIRARALTNMAQFIGCLSGDVDKFNAIQKSADFGCATYIELLRKGCSDEKAAVRKAALVLIARSITLIGSSIDGSLLRIMGLACSDPLVSIRKAALMALSEAYRRFPNNKVIHEWLHSVTPLIVDNETSIQEECENLFLELVLERISRVSKVTLNDVETDVESFFPEDVLTVLKEVTNGEVTPCIKKICGSLGKKRKLKTCVATSLQHIITTSETMWLRSSKPIYQWSAPVGAWQLLAEISCFVTKSIDWKFLHHHWQLLDKDQGKIKGDVHGDMELNSSFWAEDRVALLRTISNVSVELPPEPAADIAHSLLGRIEEFNMHLSEVDAHVKALKTLCKRKATNAEEGNNLVVKWARQLLGKALRILDNYLAELSELCKKDNLFTPPRSNRRVGKKDVSTTESSLQAVIAVFTVGSLVLVCPSLDFQGILPLLYTIITSETSTSKPKKLADFRVPLRNICPSLYIQSWVTTGKICLVDGKLAKRYIPLFVQELERSDCAALRNNIMVVMADFCVRYTSLVDCYIPKITTSLRDPCEVVRRQTFILLSRLLQSDYVKWRGVLFLRFLLCLVDESEKIRALADFLFGNILKAKAPLLAYNSFVEAIFVLNDYHTHAQSATQVPAQSRSKVLSIRGNDNKARSQRMHIYVSLLKQMAPEHLLATSAKLCAEILAAASDGLLNIDDIAGQSVLQDALQLLACKEMRIHPNRGSEAADMEDDGGESGGSASVLVARGRAVTVVAKKNLIQNAVPIFIELKRLLESKNSPLIGCLMECLRVLLKDYKNEIDEILVADKQLQKELLYDMQKYEAAKAKSTVAEAVASMQRGGNHLSPETYARVSDKLGTKKKIASAVADAAARATARTILKELNQNSATPPLRSMSVPKLKSNPCQGGHSESDKSSAVIESLRRRQTFESDDEN